MSDINITVGPDGIHGTGWEQLKQAQKAFQDKFCSSCTHWDAEAGAFKQAGHQNHPEDCRFHWTDIIGQCWNYLKREGSNDNH